MFIRKNITSLIIDDNSTVLATLKRIERNKRKLVYVVDDQNVLLGSFADGDFRRLVIELPEVKLEAPIRELVNEDCFSLPYASEHSVIAAALEERNHSIPLMDNHGRLVAVAEQGAKFFEVAGRRISREDPVFIIAEIGNNHQGSLKAAKAMVELAAASGVDCVKFQMRDMRELYGDGGVENHDLGSQYTLDLLKRFQLTKSEMTEVFDHCKSFGVIPLCTPWDIKSLSSLEEYGFDAYKVASADFTNYELLEAVADTGKLMICSTGMSTEKEIRSAINFLERRKASFILLHCNSTYPTPYKDVNLKYINRLQELSSTLVGYSGHERGFSIPLAAVALGAKVIEKHFTLDKSQEGNDHKVSLLPDELAALVSGIRAIEESLGSDQYRELSQGELINRETLAKSLYASTDLKSGQSVKESDVYIRAPGNGIQPNRLGDLIGKTLTRDVLANSPFFETDISGAVIKRKSYNFRRPYGIPVRYHDFRELTRGVELDFVEFHLSYADLDLDVSKYLQIDAKLGFAVHAPELFANDHLLDLGSFDDSYRRQSIEHLEAVIEHTRLLKTFFTKTEKPVIVVNAGGWNTERFLSEQEAREKYDLVGSALLEIDTSGVNIAIQTMPPFPWHFGGQSHHSLFVAADEIVDFWKSTGIGICLDLSHSMMACNYFGTSIFEFVKKVAPLSTHLHIVDAKGSDGEGIQIGHGDVDFTRVGRLLDEFAPNVQFIPEIWQGHADGGAGFWSALAYLETKIT